MAFLPFVPWLMILMTALLALACCRMLADGDRLASENQMH